MAAAAAVVATRLAAVNYDSGMMHGRTARGPRLRGVRGGEAAGDTCRPMCVMSFLSLALIISGLSTLAASLSNNHDELVHEYDDVVHAWTLRERSVFQNLRFNVTALWSTGSNTSVALRMESLEPTDQGLHDGDSQQGIEAYQPLKFVGEVHFQALSVNASEDGYLPNLEGATTVGFEIEVWEQNSTTSRLVASDFPIAFDEVVRPHMPAPSTKCRLEQHGVWHNKQCHLPKFLNEVCLQVEADGRGQWRLRRTQTGEAGPAGEPLGCDPERHWAPARYATDTCWVRAPTEACLAAGRQAHRVALVLRSAADPLLRAGKLTGGRLDFGPTRAVQRTLGAVLFMAGCLAMLPPLAALWCALRPTVKVEREALSPAAARVGYA